VAQVTRRSCDETVQTTNRYYSHYTAGEMFTGLAYMTYRRTSEADGWTVSSTADQRPSTLVASVALWGKPLRCVEPDVQGTN